MTGEQNKDLVDRLIEEVWTKHDAAAIDDTSLPACAARSLSITASCSPEPTVWSSALAASMTSPIGSNG
jgi:hypothetical protein